MVKDLYNELRIVVIGSVFSTSLLLKKLYDYDYRNVLVYGHTKTVESNVDKENLELCSRKFNFRYSSFNHIDDLLNPLRSFNPSLIFAVGLSQIIPKEILNISKYGCIGFHPTLLPLGRGRAPIAWLILNQSELQGAATFFRLKEGVDDGAILAQVPFEINKEDDASSLKNKILHAEDQCLDLLLSNKNYFLQDGTEQDETKSTWYGKRIPDDGLINWSKSQSEIINLIRASCSPYPGAFTYHKDIKIKIFKARKYEFPIRGVIGRILLLSGVNKNNFVVQCSDGIIEVLDWESVGWSPKVGYQLGYQIENEIYQLRKIVNKLEERIDQLENS
jgi:methionyl-tRNA formyltransferase